MSTAESTLADRLRAVGVKHRAPAMLAADVADAVSVLNAGGLPPAARVHLEAIVQRACTASGSGVPVSVAAGMLDVSPQTVRTWIERGALDVVEGVSPRSITAASLGEVLAAVASLRDADGTRVLGPVLDYLNDTRTRAQLRDRLSTLDERVELSQDEIEELFA